MDSMSKQQPWPAPATGVHCQFRRELYRTVRIIVCWHAPVATFVMAHELANRIAKGTYSVEDGGSLNRVNLRNAIMAPAAATAPYSKIIIQSGTTHARPRVRKCQT